MTTPSAPARRIDEVELIFTDGRELQLIADEIRLIIVAAEAAKWRWFGALDDPNARDEEIGQTRVK